MIFLIDSSGKVFFQFLLRKLFTAQKAEGELQHFVLMIESATRFHLCDLFGDIWVFCAELTRKKCSDFSCILLVLPKY